jgi:hypothetical protein
MHGEGESRTKLRNSALGRCRCGCEDNIKVDMKRLWYDIGQDFYGLLYNLSRRKIF